MSYKLAVAFKEVEINTVRLKYVNIHNVLQKHIIFMFFLKDNQLLYLLVE